jgi:hypothetical protein
MATFTAGPAQTGVQPKALRVGLVNVKSNLSLDGVSTSVGHTFLMAKIPAHSKISGLTFQCNITGEYTMQAGDSVNGERFRSTLTYSAGTGEVTATTRMMAYSYSADDTLIIKISLASVLTLGGGVHANVIFSMDS